MTATQTPEPSAQEPKPSAPELSTPASEPSAQAPKSSASESKSSTPKSASKKATAPRGSSWLRNILLLLLIVVLIAAGWWGWAQLQRQQLSLNAIQQQLTVQTQAEQQLQQRVEALADQLAVEQQALVAAKEQLQTLNENFTELATTSRADWLLAEAEYLLRVANQQLLTQRQASGAVALLEAVDAILLDLNEPKLFSVRKELADELAALKMTPEIDRSGLYLRLAALSGQIETLEFVDLNVKNTAVAPADSAVVAAPLSWAQRLQQSFAAALVKLQSYIQIQHHDQPLQPLLTPEYQLYVKQNLRLMLEQAQLALLREEQTVYAHSLQQARRLLLNNFRFNDKIEVLLTETEQLAAINIVQDLPDINGSLIALQAVMAGQHKLAPQAIPQMDSPVAPETPQPLETRKLQPSVQQSGEAEAVTEETR